VIVAAIALFFVATYNRLVTLRQRVKEAWADIDVQLKRRHDLIPNLVETVKGYATHESTVFQNVTQARAAAVAAGASASPQERAQAENMLTTALRSVFAVAENYPQLQAVQEFKDLSENLTATEDKIPFASTSRPAAVRPCCPSRSRSRSGARSRRTSPGTGSSSRRARHASSDPTRSSSCTTSSRRSRSAWASPRRGST